MSKILNNYKANSERQNSENILYLKYLYFSKPKFKNFLEFSNKIYNPYNKAQQKCLEFFERFDQVKQEKKTSKMLKK